MINYKHLLMFTLVLLFSNSVISQCEENIIANGSFNDSLGYNVTAAGWFADLDPSHTPDINDDSGTLYTTSSSYNWIGVPVPSLNGGSWQNIFGPEIIYQVVDLDSTKTYSLCFEYAAQGISIPNNPNLTFEDPVGVEIFINNSLLSTTPLDSTLYTWESICFEFTPLVTENQIMFKATSDNYLAIDGACLIEAIPNSLEIIDSKIISVFPNPVSIDGLLNFNFMDNQSNQYLRIVNSHGHIVWNDKMPKNNQLNLAELNLTKGIYYFSIFKNDGEIYNGKFIGN